MAGGRPVKYETAEEMQSIIDDYFENEAYVGEGETKAFMPTVSGLALALGLTRQSLINYSNKDEFFDTIKSAKQRIEVSLERKLYGQTVTGTIFNLKNNFGWKDKQEQELSGPDGGPIQTQGNITFVPVGNDPDTE